MTGRHIVTHCYDIARVMSRSLCGNSRYLDPVKFDVYAADQLARVVCISYHMQNVPALYGVICYEYGPR